MARVQTLPRKQVFGAGNYQKLPLINKSQLARQRCPANSVNAIRLEWFD